jgi:hypothetical protein
MVTRTTNEKLILSNVKRYGKSGFLQLLRRNIMAESWDPLLGSLSKPGAEHM